eukprot:g35724.t1
MTPFRSRLASGYIIPVSSLFNSVRNVYVSSEQKWKQLAELAISKCQFTLAQECLHHAQDYGGLLLLATASGNAPMVNKLAEVVEKDGKNNVAFMTYFMQGKVVKLWRENLAKINQKAAESLADPTEYENLFPGLKEAFVAEQYLKETSKTKERPARDYPLVT